MDQAQRLDTKSICNREVSQALLSAVGLPFEWSLACLVEACEKERDPLCCTEPFGDLDPAILPMEIWAHIMRQLDDRSRSNLGGTCMRFYTILKEYVGLRAHVITNVDLKLFSYPQDPVFVSRTETIRTSAYATEQLPLDRRALLDGDIELCYNGRAPSTYSQHYRVKIERNCVILYDSTRPASLTRDQLHALNDWVYSRKSKRDPIASLVDESRAIVGMATVDKELFGFVKAPFTIKNLVDDGHIYPSLCTSVFRVFPDNSANLQIRVDSSQLDALSVMAMNDSLTLEQYELCMLLIQSSLKPLIERLDDPVYWNRDHRSHHVCSKYPLQPPLLNVPLKKHQLDALEWMCQVEASVGSISFQFPSFFQIPGQRAGLQFIDDFCRVSLADETKTMISVHSRGDEMGLGKTATLISLISARPRDGRAPVRRSSERNEFKGTIVFCPSQLVKQWSSEVLKFSPDLRVVEVPSIKKLEGTSVDQLREADIVIFSQKVIENGLGQLMNPGCSINEYFRNTGWHRMICDEGLLFLQWVKSNYRWYVSGTPFPKGVSSIRAALDILKVVASPSVTKPDLYLGSGMAPNTIFTSLLYIEAKKHLFWRTMKESALDEVDIPAIKEEVHVLNLSPGERYCYEAEKLAGDPQQLRLLCTDPMSSKLVQIVAQGTSLADLSTIRTRGKAHFQSQIRDAAKRKRCAEGNQAYWMGQYSTLLLEAKKGRNDALESRINRTRTAVNRAEKQTASAIEEFTKCKEQLACFTKHTSTDCCTTSEAEQPSELVGRLGTKFGTLTTYLIDLLQSDASAKVILFSKFGHLAGKVTEALQSYGGIAKSDIVWCSGNYFVRRKAIRRFNDPFGAKIIVLSLDKAASGTHLAAASHIILLDPVVGTAEEAAATDGQAIARAHRIGQDKEVKVARFIIGNSVEQEDYEATYGKSLEDVRKESICT